MRYRDGVLNVPLTHRPTAQGARPHWVLRDAALAPVVEVVGSRFLRRYGLDSDGASSKAVHWQLRFPRVTRWARVRAGARVRVRVVCRPMCETNGTHGVRWGEG